MTVVTFYSFKGGVGRTTLATNVAGILSEAGQRVLLVDFDLEAPGLSYLTELREASGGAQSRGLAGFLADSWRLRQEQDLSSYCYPLTTLKNPIWVMPAGSTNPEKFAEDSQSIREAEIFHFGADRERSDALLRMYWGLRRRWQSTFDYVIIDSRTGFSDIGGVCTRVLPDVVVVVLSLNEQSIAGTRSVLAQIGGESVWGFTITALTAASMVPRDLRQESSDRLNRLSQVLGVSSETLFVLPFTLPLTLREEPFYFLGTKSAWVDPLVEAYQAITRKLRSSNKSDVEYRLEIARSQLLDRSRGEALEQLLTSLIADPPSLPAPRLAKTINEAADLLRVVPGTREARQRRTAIVMGSLRGSLAALDGMRQTYPEIAADALRILANAQLDEYVRLAEDAPDDDASKTARSRAAVEYYRAALGLLGAEASRSKRALLLTELADALQRIAADAGEPGTRPEGREAIEAYRAAIQLLDPNDDRGTRAIALVGLGTVLRASDLPAERAEAASLIREALELQSDGDVIERGLTLLSLAAAEIGAADVAPNKDALLSEAESAAREASQIWAAEKFPRERGTALALLARVQVAKATGVERLERLNEAVELYTQALETTPVDRFPSNHASLLVELANTRLLIGGENAKIAIEHYRRVLEILTPEDSVDQYAWALDHLGDALKQLPGDERERAQNLQEAIGLYRQAVELWKPDKYPRLYAMGLRDIAGALEDLPGEAGARKEHVTEAIVLRRRALEITTPDDSTGEYAWALNRLGDSLSKLPRDGDEDETTYLNEALSVYRRAAELWRPEKYPTEHTMALLDMARVLRRLPESQDDYIIYIRDAVRAFQGRLDEPTPGDAHHNYALAIDNLAETLIELPSSGDQQADWREAIRLYRLELEMLSPINDASDYAQALSSLALALQEFPSEDDDSDNRLTEAISLYRQAFRMISVESNPSHYARLSSNLADALIAKAAKSTEPMQDLAEAMSLLKSALKVRSRALSPVSYARSIHSLAKAYSLRGVNSQSPGEDFRTAIRLFVEAVGVFYTYGYRDELQTSIKDLTRTLHIGRSLGLRLRLPALPERVRAMIPLVSPRRRRHLPAVG